MKKIKKMGTGGLPAGSPERGGGVMGLLPGQGKLNPKPAPRGVSPFANLTPKQISELRPPGRATTGGPLPAPGTIKPPAVDTTPNKPAPARPTPAPARPSFGMPKGVLGGQGTPAKAAPMTAGKPMKKGGSVKMASGGKVSSASSRGDGCAIKGKTKGRMV